MPPNAGRAPSDLPVERAVEGHPPHPLETVPLEKGVFIVDRLADLLIAALFGGMVFFPTVVAPLVFRVLDEQDAGRFLRALFPRYYAFIIGLAGLAGLARLTARPVDAGLLFAVAASTLWVRQRLVPRINAARDASLAGDEAATVRFERGHRLSVGINVVQMVVVLGLIVAR